MCETARKRGRYEGKQCKYHEHGSNRNPLKDREGCLKANASVIFNNVFKVTGIRIGISKNGNTFVSMPDYKTGKLDDNGKDIYQDIAYPVTRQFWQEMYEKIVKEFNAVMEREGKQEDDANANEE